MPQALQPEVPETTLGQAVCPFAQASASSLVDFKESMDKAKALQEALDMPKTMRVQWQRR